MTLILLYNELCTNFAQYIQNSRQSVTRALAANGWLRSIRRIRKVSEIHFPSYYVLHPHVTVRKTTNKSVLLLGKAHNMDTKVRKRVNKSVPLLGEGPLHGHKS